ncbi:MULTISPECIES: PIN/TRAM domain-containing protein [Exiguobacterium]|uniref:PilT protein domain protein n=1 Tax=Exiguobacterium sibiricum (strain DSM 17290 / CCUG 55495 / CIP 109462 / JCM 13490 / 255-15) TaxID=262543 RepID=B1YGS4_EXIS2|nr:MULTISPECIES: PIN/TRAM domain-containing protein [Exiguobacterium]ACB59557.1 PilT protein domain protein [Exiguobacterium sibiricum 255-15]MCT4791202.1 PIN/TRAM domain-containing protein [Exiguobacterium artemiae]MDX1261088.1 PIN/TRAM domain-containing protein [Exiguobacterium sp. K1]HCN56847.1 PIN/TRAM domain-containing protein [Exiguobacterium sp.]
MKIVIRIFFALLGLALGILLLPQLFQLIEAATKMAFPEWLMTTYVTGTIGALIFLLIGLFITDSVIRLLRFLEEKLVKAPVADLFFGTFGLLVGLVMAFLVSMLIELVGIPLLSNVLTVIVAVLFGYLGFTVGYRKRHELTKVFLRNSNNQSEKKAAEPVVVAKSNSKVLDTSVIIDGRITDIAKTGFVEGKLIVPQFVIGELQYIADSSDTLKRNRGRRGLDVLKELQSIPGMEVEIYDGDFEDVPEVDIKLIKLAELMKGIVVTNDYNLNKVCEVRNVPVLNINDLANAVKQVVIPGEEMTVLVIKEGKEQKQGIAYLEDGTMVVVEEGKHLISKTVGVVVTSVLQTSAGRMIFAKPQEK